MISNAALCYKFCADMCNEIGAVRLVGGVSMIAGRLEICVDNHWGSVCNDGFDANAAAVVCRQLGFQESGMCCTGIMA